MKIDKPQLLQIIRQEIEAVLNDLELLLPLPLPAEPNLIGEAKSRVNKIIGILNQLEQSERERIFAAFKRYSYAAFLEQIRAYEIAKKP
jgi:hypothetical protein